MDTIQLNHAIYSRSDLSNKDVFKGTYAINQIPHAYTVNPPFAFIINTSPWPSRGDHWVAIYCVNNNKLEYFDSAGKPPPKSLTTMWSHLGNPSIVYNTQRLQSYCTTLCGEYCLLYIYCRMNNITFDSFLSFFSQNYISNDRKVYRIVHNVFQILPHARPFPVFNRFCIQLSRRLKHNL